LHVGLAIVRSKWVEHLNTEALVFRRGREENRAAPRFTTERYQSE